MIKQLRFLEESVFGNTRLAGMTPGSPRYSLPKEFAVRLIEDRGEERWFLAPSGESSLPVIDVLVWKDQDTVVFQGVEHKLIRWPKENSADCFIFQVGRGC